MCVEEDVKLKWEMGDLLGLYRTGRRGTEV